MKSDCGDRFSYLDPSVVDRSINVKLNEKVQKMTLKILDCDIDLRFLPTFAMHENWCEGNGHNAWRLLSGVLAIINLVRDFNKVILVT